MRSIKISFSGMSGLFNPENNFIVNILRKYFKVELSNDPDFLIYSVNSKDHLNYKCVRIFFTPENLVPDFNICDYAIGFHFINFEDRYIRFPLYLVDSFKAYPGDAYDSDLLLALHKHESFNSSQKTDFCAFVYSNGEAAQCRDKMFTALSEYKPVNSGGRYKNTVGGPVESKLEFQKKHKFVIAFENSSTPGYTTEKIVHAFAAGAIPIYWGNPEIIKEFNPESFVNCHDFGLTDVGEEKVIKRIVERVKVLNQDDEEYKKIITTPAFVEANYTDRKQKEFEDFLIHIFSQDKEYAYRRNRLYWGERYERKQKIGNYFYWQCRKIIPIRDKLRLLFSREK